MANVGCCRVLVIITAVLITLGGAASLYIVLGDIAVGGSNTTVYFGGIVRVISIIIAAIWAGIGVFGIISGIIRKKFLAAIYFIALLLVTVIIAAAWIALIVVADRYISSEDICATGQTSSDPGCQAIIDDTAKYLKIAIGVLLGINIVACGGCTLCAGCYWRALVHDD